ncbi:amidohydrolase family protein [Acetobacter musti]|uniref:Adenine deaminase n=1 Tax=Acetobacter musti TaxID=864732 RepID=A0ABX0JK64_9PROT|nr:adenine deaminase C-terminal domain-containing protein [Acetobacter musti]NHN83277.1 amidohydrolase family protein [Acetobacter musti]
MNGQQITRSELVDVAMGRRPASVAIRNARIVNVLSREIHDGEILILGDRIAALGPSDPGRPEPEQVIDAAGLFAMPGLIDPHLHTESCAVTLAEFAGAVVPRGVTTAICDPHEYGNIMGWEGIRLWLEESRRVPMSLLLRVAPRVPELPPELETAGGSWTMARTLELLALPEAACLAGDIHPRFTLENDPRQRRLIDVTIALGKTVSGYSPGLSGRELSAYVAAGVEDSHTPHDVEELCEDLRAGLHLFLTPRPGRFGPDQFRALAGLIAREGIDTRRICLCTDDVPADRLLTEGHLDYRVRLAIRSGIPALTALQMATINSAEAMRIDRDYGSVTPGKKADIILSTDAELSTVRMVLRAGRVVARDGELVTPVPPFPCPPEALRTMERVSIPAPEKLLIPLETAQETVLCRVIAREGEKVFRPMRLPVRGGLIRPDPEQDVVSLAVLDRYQGSGRIGRGFAYGTGLRRGAVASSINHNAHDPFVAGVAPEDMACALRRLVEIGGGYVAALDGRIIAEQALPVVGMISEAPLAEVAAGLRAVEQAVITELGCSLTDQPLLQLSFFCSPVVPRVGLTDFGLVDTDRYDFADVVAEPVSSSAHSPDEKELSV